jgi:hypothetical protein
LLVNVKEKGLAGLSQSHGDGAEDCRKESLSAKNAIILI